MPVEPVMANRFVIGLAVQLFRRHPRPKVCCRDASSEKWLKLVLSVTPRGPWFVMTIVTIWDFAKAPSSNVMTIALFPVDHVDDEVIALTISPAKASICAIRKLCWTEFITLKPHTTAGDRGERGARRVR